MTELQTTIKSLTQTIIDETLLLGRLERQQKDLEESKVPKFPGSFIMVPDMYERGLFVIGLHKPSTWSELPDDFKGRACFTKKDIQQIIDGLQMLIGVNND